MFNLEGKLVLITGINGQLGGAISETLLNQGCLVTGIDLPPILNAANNQRIGYLQVDITKKEELRSALRQVTKRFGRIDALVCNAGVSVFESFLERPEASLDYVYNVNLKGTINSIVEYLKVLQDTEQKSQASIVNIASLYGLISPDPRIYVDLDRKNSEIYGATKAAIIQLTKYYAVHARDFRVRVNCVSPGGVLNEKNPQGEGFQKEYASRCPMGRMAKDTEIANAVAFLISDAASYVNGHNLIVDGGFSCW